LDEELQRLLTGDIGDLSYSPFPLGGTDIDGPVVVDPTE
jgi:hypothetical protein